MCGIGGVIGKAITGSVDRMQAALRHRGPDAAGSWTSSKGNASLVHTRLAILDLTQAGNQPMMSTDARYVLVFNGEIYNFEELKLQLAAEGSLFSSNSDTEVLLEGLRRHGKAFIPKLRGMFAFCLWDTVNETALLARDPLGIKPLYVFNQNNTLVFASEVRAVLASDIVPRQLDAAAVAGYFTTGSVPEPRSLVKNVEMLPPGHTLEWSATQVKREKFWELSFEQKAHQHPVETAREALLSSLKAHLVSDVDVGIFLSGGIDSTAILALARQIVPQGTLKTFSIAVDDPNLDEASAAASTAKQFSTEHHEFKIDAKEATSAFESYLSDIDSPSVDGFNTWIVSRWAAQNGMKVVLSGLGGDELMAGYKTFIDIPKLHRWGKIAAHFGPFTQLLGWLLCRFAATSKFRRLGEYLRTPPTLPSAYQAMRGVFTATEAGKLANHYCHTPSTATSNVPNLPIDERDAVSFLELTNYMRNQLLRDSDVMSMAHGLELRVPLVDAQLCDTLASIPADVRLQNGKQLFLQAVPEIPERISKARKKGFRFPFTQWLTSSFGKQFTQAATGLPVKATEWYQQWAVFVFNNWCKRNKIEP